MDKYLLIELLSNYDVTADVLIYSHKIEKLNLSIDQKVLLFLHGNPKTIIGSYSDTFRNKINVAILKNDFSILVPYLSSIDTVWPEHPTFGWSNHYYTIMYKLYHKMLVQPQLYTKQTKYKMTPYTKGLVPDHYYLNSNAKIDIVTETDLRCAKKGIFFT